MKIITYSNPFELKELEDVWSEKYPHLCVSQTLVEGLKEYYGRGSFDLICTIDKFISCFYDQWYNNTENELFQFVELSKAIRSKQNSTLKRAFTHNRSDVLKALRFMIEADIEVEAINNDKLNKEQLYLVDLFRELMGKECFLGLENQSQRGYDGLENCAIDILKEELQKYIKLTKEEKEQGLSKKLLTRESLNQRINQKIAKLKGSGKESKKMRAHTIQYISDLYNNCVEERKKISFEKVIFHGIHQFTPILLKFINRLEELDIEVVFLINYCKEFESIYETWHEVYKWTHTTMEHRGSLDYVLPRKVGENLGLIFEGRMSECTPVGEAVNKFTNLTAFADYVVPIFGRAQKEANKNKEANDDSSEDRLASIALMEEQFYAVNGSDLNEILKVYFPEHFGGRHFLSYPIGQFILGLYNMWHATQKRNVKHSEFNNTQKLNLEINPKDLKECLAINIWKTQSRITPLEIYYDLMVYFRNVTTIEEYIKRLDKIIKIVEKKNEKERLNRFSFFKYKPYDLKQFKKVIETIQKLAHQLFAHEEVGLGRHFGDLMRGISEISADMELSEGELSAINEIKNRLEHITMEDVVANVADIRDTVHFYLASNKPEDYKAEWIVRDFEQIDGGVLLAKAEQEKRSRQQGSTCYHFGGVSDRNMLGGVTANLPWPLTVDMIDSMNNITRIVSTCKKEYPHFLRYSLFYGTYFLSSRKDIIFSYVEEEGDDKKANLYSPLSLLGLKEENKVEQDLFEKEREYEPTYVEQLVDFKQELKDSETRSAVACYRRFLFNHCLDEDTCFNTEFDLFYIAQLFSAYEIDQKIENHQDRERVKKQYRNLLPFMDEMDYLKIEKIMGQINHSYSEATQKNYQDTKLEFKFTQWREEGCPNDLLKHIFDAKKMNPDAKNLLVRNLDEFINTSDMNYLPETHNWKVCEVCNQRDICCHYIEIREQNSWEENY